jgi:RNA polymerase sigma-70 factor, ECF subfamily
MHMKQEDSKTARTRHQGPLPDAALTARFLRGDESAFDAIVRRHEGTVRSILTRLTGNADDGEELAQETFMRVYISLSRFRGKASLRTWILRIATNLARDLLRSRRRKSPPLPLGAAELNALEAPINGGPPAVALFREKSRAVAAALEQLPFKQRAALICKIIGDMGYDEIARVIGSTRNSVKSNIHLGRRRLMAILGDRL